MIRAKKRNDFEKHREIRDLNVIDLLLFKSHQEYQETMNCWKQEVSAPLVEYCDVVWRDMTRYGAVPVGRGAFGLVWIN
jgi:hypothetical protein